MPRSIIYHLEEEIQALEVELGQNGHLDVFNASDILIHMPSDSRGDEEPIIPSQVNHQSEHGNRHEGRDNDLHNLEEESSPDPSDSTRLAILASKNLHSMITATSPLGPDLTDLVFRVRMGFTPSTAKASTTPTDVRRSAISPRADRTTLETRVLKSLPSDLAQSLVKKYIYHLLPQYPFLRPKTIRDQLERVLKFVQFSQLNVTSPLSVDEPAPSYDCLMIYLIMAISVTLGSAKGGHETRCLALSTALYEEGIQHWPSRSCIPSDLAEVQLNLLILLYASINPRAGNVWVLCGAAMRSCFELGLHREAPEITQNIDPDTLNLRRHIFWSAYCLDRAICSVLHRPLSIPDVTINTQFPSLQDKSVTSGARIQWTTLHQLQSEIIEIHFQGAPLPNDMTWNDWVTSMEHKIRALNRKWEVTVEGVDEMRDFSYFRFLFTLHRPSPRMPMPSQPSLLTCFESATQWAKLAMEHFERGFFRRPWLATHHNFEAAMIVLFALRHATSTIREKFDAREVFERTKLFTSNFLIIASQGWSEVAGCAGIYERLLGPLLESVFSPENHFGINNNQNSGHFGPAQDAELTRLLYPGPAQLKQLRLGIQPDVLDFSNNARLFDVRPTDVPTLCVDDRLSGIIGTTDLDMSMMLDQEGVLEGMAYPNWDLLDHWFFPDPGEVFV